MGDFSYDVIRYDTNGGYQIICNWKSVCEQRVLMASFANPYIRGKSSRIGLILGESLP